MSAVAEWSHATTETGETQEAITILRGDLSADAWDRLGKAVDGLLARLAELADTKNGADES